MNPDYLLSSKQGDQELYREGVSYSYVLPGLFRFIVKKPEKTANHPFQKGDWVEMLFMGWSSSIGVTSPSPTMTLCHTKIIDSMLCFPALERGEHRAHCLEAAF